jgi:probable F420-dependent oxidoreductase
MALELARLAETSGITALRLPDHVVMGPRTDRYRWGDFAYPVDVPWLDPLATIASMAAVTSRLRFCTSILIAPLRPAAVLAKMAATIDVLSGGRLELGVGTGWQEEEYLACGATFGARGVALTDTVAACRALWGASPASFHSRTISFDDIWCEPKPVQPGGIPVFFAGTLNDRNIDRVVRLGDGWIPILNESVGDLARDIPVLRDAWHAAGRDPERLHIQARLDVRNGTSGRPDVHQTLAGARALLDLGVTDLQLASMPFMSDTSDMARFVDDLGTAWSDFLVTTS